MERMYHRETVFINFGDMILFILVFSSVAVVYADEIETRLGRVGGTTRVASNGRLFKIYQGIPYAKPPIGNLRFQPPVPVKKWNNTFNATNIPPLCPQILESTSDYRGNEDCLYVNVYTPQNAKPGANIPVIVYIFGGVFKFGYPLKHGPEFMLTRDIVLVVVSFRIGVLGFLSTGDSVVSGNMALKDQLLALKWTKRNIYYFGGDPNNITLQGHSSGAVCVHMHTLSPMSKGYFNRVIIQSGMATAPPMFNDKDTSRGISTALADKVNCPIESTTELVRCLLTKDAEDLVRMAEEIKIWMLEPAAVFKPTFEDKYVKNAFLTEIPVSAPYASTEPSWLVGMTSSEAASYVSGFLVDPQESKDVATVSQLVQPIIESFLWTSKPAHVDYITRSMMARFFGDEPVGRETDHAFVELMTGLYHGMCTLEAVQKYKGLKYLYLYDYRANWTYKPTEYGKFLGVKHADEIYLLFPTENHPLTEADYEFGQEMITRWINFAYTGNPNEPFSINTTIMSPWNPMTSSRLEFLRIKQHGFMEADYFREKYEYWMSPFTAGAAPGPKASSEGEIPVSYLKGVSFRPSSVECSLSRVCTDC